MSRLNLQKALAVIFSAVLIAGCTVDPASETPLVEFSVDATSVQHRHDGPALTATDNSTDPAMILKYFDESGNPIGEGSGSADLMVEWTGERAVSAECYCDGQKLGYSNAVAVTGLDSPPERVLIGDKGLTSCEEDIEIGVPWSTTLEFSDVNGDAGEVTFLRVEYGKNPITVEYELPNNATLTPEDPQAGKAGRAVFTWTAENISEYKLYFRGYIPDHGNSSVQETCITLTGFNPPD